MAETGQLPLPRGMASPLDVHRLALRLGMTVAELKHGRGAPMSASEIAIDWPLYWQAESRIAARRAKK